MDGCLILCLVLGSVKRQRREGNWVDLVRQQILLCTLPNTVTCLCHFPLLLFASQLFQSLIALPLRTPDRPIVIKSNQTIDKRLDQTINIYRLLSTTIDYYRLSYSIDSISIRPAQLSRIIQVSTLDRQSDHRYDRKQSIDL
jgi:hypothetical protein